MDLHRLTVDLTLMSRRFETVLKWININHGQVPAELETELLELELGEIDLKPTLENGVIISDGFSGGAHVIEIEPVPDYIQDFDEDHFEDSSSALPKEEILDPNQTFHLPQHSVPVQAELPPMVVDVPARKEVGIIVQTKNPKTKFRKLSDGRILNSDSLHIPNTSSRNIEAELERYPCTHCTQHFSSICELSVHNLTHSEVQLNRVSISKKNLQLQARHPDRIKFLLKENKLIICKPKNPKSLSKPLPAIAPKYTCDICNRNFTEHSYMKKHKATVHAQLTSDITFSCDKCDKVYKSRYHLADHVRWVHSNLQRKHLCQVCGYVTKKASSLKVHLKRHSNERPFKCEHCAAVFKTSGTLQRHISVHMGTRNPSREPKNPKSLSKPVPAIVSKYTCDICNRSFTEHSYVKIHKATVHAQLTSDTTFSCDKCDKVYKSRYHLAGHVRWVHSNLQRKHLCQVCGHATKSASSLKVHLKRHLNERPFKCEHCAAAFKTRTSLRRHVSVHMGTRQKKCPYCDVKATQMSNHVNIVHKGRKFKCTYCCSKYSLRAHLKNHIVLKHPDFPMPDDSEFIIIFTKTLPDVNSIEAVASPVSLQEPPTPTIKRKLPKTDMRKTKRPKVEKSSGLSCPSCVGATFNTHTDLELHMMRHMKDPDYRLRHRVLVKRLNNEQLPTTPELMT